MVEKTRVRPEIPAKELTISDVMLELFRQKKQMNRMEATLINLEKKLEEKNSH